MQQNTKYKALDGLRAYAAIGIVMMHVLANGNYDIPGFIGTRMIPSFTNFVFLFMTVSAFGLCCGYYERFADGTIQLERFFAKRYLKVLPFFAFMSLIDVVLNPRVENVFELFANVTLLYGLLPNANITVIGVGWFLGLIFVFYLLFPFFTVLLKSKKRAWAAFAVAMIYNILCQIYFTAGRGNIIYCAIYFIAGGLIYLYRDKIEEQNPWLLLGVTAISVAVYYLVDENAFTCLLVSSSLLAVGISSKKPWGGYWKTALQPLLEA